jgi:hypothetical protein
MLAELAILLVLEIIRAVEAAVREQLDLVVFLAAAVVRA